MHTEALYADCWRDGDTSCWFYYEARGSRVIAEPLVYWGA